MKLTMSVYKYIIVSIIEPGECSRLSESDLSMPWFNRPQHEHKTQIDVGSLMTSYIARTLCQQVVQGKPLSIKGWERSDPYYPKHL